MNITLRQARRLEREIGTEQVEVHGNINTSGIHGLAVSIYEKLDDGIAQVQSKTVEAVEKSFRLGAIRASIRKSIETLNEVAGLNRLINEEALLKERAKLLGSIMTAELTDKELEVVRARHAVMLNTGGTVSNYGSHTDSVTLQHTLRKETLDLFRAQAKDIQRRLLKLVDELSALNSSTVISISAEDIAFLEANSIIVS